MKISLMQVIIAAFVILVGVYVLIIFEVQISLLLLNGDIICTVKN